MMDSDAWQSLDATQRALYVETLRRYTGFNNGHIGFGVREAGQALHIKPHTAGLAFGVLMERGFLVCAKDSTFGQKKLAREWRITALSMGPWDAPTSPPTNDYMRWRPSGMLTEKQKPVPFGDTLSAVWGHTGPENEAETAPTVAPNGTKAASLSAVSVHTSISMGDQDEQ